MTSNQGKCAPCDRVRTETKSLFGIRYETFYFQNEPEPESEKKIDLTIYSASYNHYDYLSDYFEGINSQEVSYEVDVVIVDDKSNKKSFERMFDLALASKFNITILRFFENQHHNKITRALIGLSHARGDYIAYCETDDYWTDSQKLEKQISFLNQNKGYSWSITKATRLDETKGEELIMLDADFTEPHTFIKDVLSLAWGALPTATMVFRRSAIELHKKTLSEQTIEQPDEYLAVMIASRVGSCFFLPDVTATYRFNNKTSFTKKIMSKPVEKMKHYKEASMLYANYASTLGAPELIAPTLRLIVWQSLQYVSFLYPHKFYAAFEKSLSRLPKNSMNSPTLIFGRGIIHEYLTKNFSHRLGDYMTFDSSTDDDAIRKYIAGRGAGRSAKAGQLSPLIIVSPAAFGQALAKRIEKRIADYPTIRFHLLGDDIYFFLCGSTLSYLEKLNNVCDSEQLLKISTPASKGPLSN